ncbi:MAG: beta-ketoacyl-ACP synthase [Chromatiales bacterium]|jgi:3-oxoacyl-[acyl-carrier-protein] synthase I|nr:beta-ketoacyl-ACP synthase [Chromatiales bacterium]
MPHTGITSYALVTCLGHGRAAHLDAMREGRSGLTPCDYPELPFECFAGSVAGLAELTFPAHMTDYDNRANRLAFAALESDGFRDAVEHMRARWGAGRCGIVVGTSTSGVEKLEQVYRERADGDPLADDYLVSHHDNHHAVAAFLQEYLELTGPSYTISTACSSSAKALVDAVQLIDTEFCDAVLVGGVDSLCLTSLNGFESLQLVSRAPCRPCDEARNGLSLGEGAALLIVERDTQGTVRISGVGESSDGVSMSTPPEDGAGAAAAMRAALCNAGINADQVGYVNLHGTATPVNDAAECAAVMDVFGPATPASSLKGMVGHTLGSAGAVEAVMCAIALEEGLIPGNVGLETLDPKILCNIVPQTRQAPYTHALSNAFGFGGSNCALLLSK